MTERALDTLMLFFGAIVLAVELKSAGLGAGIFLIGSALLPTRK